MSSDNKTEEPTPRRREKARKKGQVARSRELPSALAIFAVVFVLAWNPQQWVARWQEFFRGVMATSSQELSSLNGIMVFTGWAVFDLVASVVFFGWVAAVMSLIAQGGFIIAPSALQPKFARLQPGKNIKQIFSMQSVSKLLKAVIPVLAVMWLLSTIMDREWEQLVTLPRLGFPDRFGWMMSLLFEIAWKAAFALLLWSGVDYLLQRLQHEKSLRMTKQEVRDESKDVEGNPEIRGRIRRLQREMRKRMMLKDVERATAVVTNPEHYAVALEFDPMTMDAPVVVAKGRNLLAQEIKKRARWNNIPLVENPLLAQALYRAVEVGQVIPAKLYAAVAEILAFIFRTQARMQGTGNAVPPGVPGAGV